MPVLEIIILTLVVGWLFSLELRYWRTFRFVLIADTIIKALTRYAREAKRGEDDLT
jgi:hypothetical protein